MPQHLKRFLTVILCLALCCCVHAPKKNTGKAPEKEPAVVQTETPVVDANTSSQTTGESTASKEETITEYVNKVINMSGDAQKKELQELTQILQNNKQDSYSKTKLALLYGLPASRVRDYVKAQTLADELLKEKLLDNERKSMMIIMRDYLAETIRVSMKLREEQKKSEAYQSKLDAIQLKVDTVQQRADSLQQKLDELKNIEKTIIDRNHENKK